MALVTGGAFRIGRAICEMLADCGAHVIIHYRSSASGAAELQDQFDGRGVRSFTLQADLVSEEACRELIEQAAAFKGSLDILVNNAAVFRKDPLATTTADKLIGEFWPNLFAPILVTRAFAARAKPGRVVNMLDRRVAGLDPSCLSYVLSKKALADFTRMAALDLAPDITVNAVAPGAILPPPGAGETYMEEHADPVPLERPCTPVDVAAAVRYLLCEDAVTGQVLYIDGGQHLVC